MDQNRLGRAVPRALAALFALATFAAFSLVRFGSSVPGTAGDVLPGSLLIGVLAATAAAAASLAFRDRSRRVAALVSLGAPAGLAAYLVVALAAFGSSTDSPTWLLFLLFVALCLALGAVGAAAGALLRRSGHVGVPRN